MLVVSAVISFVFGAVALWAVYTLGTSLSTAALLALLPALSMHLRWQRKGWTALIAPVLVFVLSFGVIVGAQTYAFQFTSTPFDAMIFLLYPSLAMCACLTLLGIRSLLRQGRPRERSA